MKIDLLLTKADVFNVYLKSWIPADVAVVEGKILYVGDSSDKGFDPLKTVDCGGAPLIPGMIDIHLHIESSYCTPQVFSHAVLGCGVTTVVSEPHEMANVFGSEGIEEMIRLSGDCALDIFYAVPSSVPSTSADFETSGGSISPEDAQTLFLKYPRIICVGEIMTYASLLKGDTRRTREFINAVRRRNVLPAVEGHCPGIIDLDLARVLFEGVDSDHCLQSSETMVQRFEQGMFVELQYKSLTAALIETLKAGDYRGLYSFVTDDTSPDILEQQGHLDGVIRKALSLGLPLEDAVIASSHAPAKRMGFRDRGAVSPGMKADFLLLADKGTSFKISSVYKDGLEYRSVDIPHQGPGFKEQFRNSINLRKENLDEVMFELHSPVSGPSVKVRTIIKNSTDTSTAEGLWTAHVQDGLVQWEKRDCNLIVVLERYSGKGAYSQGVLEGCFFKGAALATSHAHDSHNILIAGDNSSDMKLARDWVIDHRGGICFCRNGEIAAAVVLPVGGILSELPLSQLSEKMISLSSEMRAAGFIHPNPIMSFSTLTLPVSPAIKITDKGIILTEQAEIVSLFPET